MPPSACILRLGFRFGFGFGFGFGSPPSACTLLAVLPADAPRLYWYATAEATAPPVVGLWLACFCRCLRRFSRIAGLRRAAHRRHAPCSRVRASVKG